jgi:hypothetical protein
MKLSPIEIFKGKKIFFIGGTGFVGKVTLSMLLHYWNADASVRNECRFGTKSLLILDRDSNSQESHAGGTGVCGRGRPRSV